MDNREGYFIESLCLLSAGESAPMTVSVACLPPIVAVISIAMSPAGDPEPDDIAVVYPSKCSGAVDLPVSGKIRLA